MKTVYTADKITYGEPFMATFESFEDLKRSIFDSHFRMNPPIDKVVPEYNEKTVSGIIHVEQYIIYRIELHEDEEIQFEEYGGSSHHMIVKKDRSVLSKTTPVIHWNAEEEWI